MSFILPGERFQSLATVCKAWPALIMADPEMWRSVVLTRAPAETRCLHPDLKLCISTGYHARSGGHLDTPANDVRLDEYHPAKLALLGFLPVSVHQLSRISNPAWVRTLFVHICWRDAGGCFSGEAECFDALLEELEGEEEEEYIAREHADQKQREKPTLEFIEQVLARGFLRRFSGVQALRFPLEWMDDSALHALGSHRPKENAQKQQCTLWLTSLALELKAGMRGGLETLDLGSPKADWHNKPAPFLKLGALPTAFPRLRHLPDLHAIRANHATLAKWPSAFRQGISTLSLRANVEGVWTGNHFYSGTKVWAKLGWTSADVYAACRLTATLPARTTDGLIIVGRRGRGSLASLTPRLKRLRLETYAAPFNKLCRLCASMQLATQEASCSVECTMLECNCIMLALLGRTHLDRELFEAILSLPTSLEALYLLFSSASLPLPLPCSYFLQSSPPCLTHCQAPSHPTMALVRRCRRRRV